MTAAVYYERPATLDTALELLQRPASLALAGGTGLNAGPRRADALLVDLQGLGLAGMTQPDASTLLVGAMTRLDELMDDERTPVWLAALARHELPSSLRTLATVGGTAIAGGWESAFVAGLLACDALAVLAGRDGERTVPLAALLADPATLEGRIVLSLRLSVDGVGTVHATARTSADRPIVAVVVRRTNEDVRVAMSGVAATAMVVGAVEELAPPADFRGSTEYRRHLAQVLQDRAFAELGVHR